MCVSARTHVQHYPRFHVLLCGIRTLLFDARVFLWMAYWYCFEAIVTGLTVFIIGAFSYSEERRTLNGMRYSLLGFLATATLIVVATLLTGISHQTLLEGVVIDPLKTPALFNFALLVGRPPLFV